MSSQKWTLLQVYTDDKLGITHFIMYKDAKDEQEALNNIWIADRRHMENEAYIAQHPISLNAELGNGFEDEENDDNSWDEIIDTVATIDE